jgi:hypothetical protein
MSVEFLFFPKSKSRKENFMAIKLKDLPQELQRRVSRKAKVRMSLEEVKKHALAVAALLVDDRNLSASEARRVFTKAIALLR